LAWAWASLRMTVAFDLASARLFSPLSAAARPSAIFFWRSVIATISGGQMNFMVTHASTKNTSVWMSIVALRFMEAFSCLNQRPRSSAMPLRGMPRVAQSLLDERVRSGEPQRDTDTDDERCVDQTEQQE